MASRRSVAVPDALGSSRAVDDVVDRTGEDVDVVGLDRREQRDPELVTAELSVRFDVDDAVGAERGGDRGGVDPRRRSRSSP